MRSQSRIAILLSLIILTGAAASATDLRKIVGSNHLGPSYTFKPWALCPTGDCDNDGCEHCGAATCDILNEGADELLSLGTSVIRVELMPNADAIYHYTSKFKFPAIDPLFQKPPAERLVEVAKSAPYNDLFHKSFSTFIITVRCNMPVLINGPLGTYENPPDYSFCGIEKDKYLAASGGTNNEGAPLFDGFSAAERAAEKGAIKNLAKYLLQTFAGSGKTFVIATQEMDWVGVAPRWGDLSALIAPERVPVLIDWINARQEGVDEARAEVPPQNVSVLNSAEVNALTRAIDHSRITITNDVLPFTHCDLYSMTAYGGESQNPPLLTQHLDYLASKAPDSKGFGSKNIFLGEYIASEKADENARESIRRQTEIAVGWGVRYATMWTLYDVIDSNAHPGWCRNHMPTNDDLDGAWLVRPDGTKPLVYFYLQGLMNKQLVHAGIRTQAGTFLSAEDAGGGVIHLNAPLLRAWESLTVIDHNGGVLVSGDSISILTNNGHYVMAWDNGGGAVDATSAGPPAAWEQFTIWKQNGTGSIVDGDSIAIKAGSGHYLVADATSGLLRGTASTPTGAAVFRLVTQPLHVRGDANGDGIADVFWRHDNGENSLWLLQPGVVNAVPLPTTEPLWKIVSSGDYNGDGKTDLLWRHFGNFADYIWFLDGNSVTSAYYGVADQTWSVLGSADFDGNGLDDILWRRNDGVTSAWMMFPGSLQPRALPIADPSWIAAGFGDVTGDGKADIIWRHLADGAISLWIMNGADSVNAVSLSPVDSSWTLAAVGDFGGDGKADLFWRHTSGENFQWQMNGAAVTGLPMPNVPDTSYKVVACADFSGDGKADLFWRHDANGLNWVWQMNGGLVTAISMPTAPDTTWRVQAPK